MKTAEENTIDRNPIIETNARVYWFLITRKTAYFPGDELPISVEMSFHQFSVRELRTSFIINRAIESLEVLAKVMLLFDGAEYLSDFSRDSGNNFYCRLIVERKDNSWVVRKIKHITEDDEVDLKHIPRTSDVDE